MIEVVAAAVIHAGRVLAARRSRPAGLAGRWEFPGGKIEPGEDAPAALVREIREELALDVVIHDRLAVADDAVVRVALFAATVVGDCVPRTGTDHDELCWLAPADLASVRWLPIDAGFVQSVRSRLRGDGVRSTL